MEGEIREFVLGFRKRDGGVVIERLSVVGEIMLARGRRSLWEWEYEGVVPSSFFLVGIIFESQIFDLRLCPQENPRNEGNTVFS